MGKDVRYARFTLIFTGDNSNFKLLVNCAVQKFLCLMCWQLWIFRRFPEKDCMPLEILRSSYALANMNWNSYQALKITPCQYLTGRVPDRKLDKTICLRNHWIECTKTSSKNLCRWRCLNLKQNLLRGGWIN